MRTLGVMLKYLNAVKVASYRNLMAYAVVPVFHQVLFKELVLTGSEGVLELTAVAQTNFLIPALTANSLFALER